MTRIQLDRVLEFHRLWLAGEGGERADLSGSNLRDANLSGAYLYRANLQAADLTNAVFPRANLRSADLRSADLTGAFLYDANLGGVRTNWFTRMTARGTRNLTDEQRAQLGTQPLPRVGNARRSRTTTDLARRLAR